MMSRELAWVMSDLVHARRQEWLVESPPMEAGRRPLFRTAALQVHW